MIFQSASSQTKFFNIYLKHFSKFTGLILNLSLHAFFLQLDLQIRALSFALSFRSFFAWEIFNFGFCSVLHSFEVSFDTFSNLAKILDNTVFEQAVDYQLLMKILIVVFYLITLEVIFFMEIFMIAH